MRNGKLWWKSIRNISMSYNSVLTNKKPLERKKIFPEGKNK